MTGGYVPTARTSPSRNPGRVSYDRAAVHAVLDEALVCHVGFVVDGLPVVVPGHVKDWARQRHGDHPPGHRETVGGP